MMRPLAASIFLLLIAMAGCEKPIPFTFQIVDAKTGKGLQDVKLEAPVTGHYFGIHAFPADDPDIKLMARTDAQGLMTLDLKVEKDLNYFLFLTKPGYEAITGYIYPFTGHSELKTRPSDTLPAMGFGRDLPDIRITPGQTNIIPMQPLAGSP